MQRKKQQLMVLKIEMSKKSKYLHDNGPSRMDRIHKDRRMIRELSNNLEKTKGLQDKRHQKIRVWQAQSTKVVQEPLRSKQCRVRESKLRNEASHSHAVSDKCCGVVPGKYTMCES